MLPEKINGMISRLENEGFKAYAVGGCVRDLLSGRQPSDFDICTSALPQQTEKVFSHLQVVETGLKHGTVTVIFEGEPVEITTFRLDGDYKDGRRPESVSFTRDVMEDLKRRDFTVNAMAYNEREGLIDPFGGECDLKARVLRCVGEPEKRFHEDGLRVMRALRFCSCLDLEWEANTGKAIHECKGLLKKISAERICRELLQLLTGNCGKILREFYDVFSVIIPEIEKCHGFQQFSKYHCMDVWEHIVTTVENIPPRAELRLAMLLHDLGKPACFKMEDGQGHFKGHGAVGKEIAQRVTSELKCDSKTSELVVFLVAHHDMPMDDNPANIKRMLGKYGWERYNDLLLVHIADDTAKDERYRGRIDTYRHAGEIAEEIKVKQECFSLKSLSVNGNDMIEVGLKGREIGEALNLLLEAVITGKCENNRETLLEYIKGF